MCPIPLMLWDAPGFPAGPRVSVRRATTAVLTSSVTSAETGFRNLNSLACELAGLFGDSGGSEGEAQLDNPTHTRIANRLLMDDRACVRLATDSLARLAVMVRPLASPLPQPLPIVYDWPRVAAGSLPIGDDLLRAVPVSAYNCDIYRVA